MNSLRLGAVLIFGLAAAAPAIGQDIKCDQVFMNPSEKQICASEALMQQDDLVGELYRRAEPHFDKMKQGQREFRRALKSCKGDLTCLTTSYEFRIEELKQAVNTLPPPTAGEVEQLAAEASSIDDQRASDLDDRMRLEAEAAREAEISVPDVVSEPQIAAPVEEASPSEVVEPATSPAAKDVEFAWWVKWVVVGIGILFLFWIWIVIQELFGRCPRCKKWHAAVLLDQRQKAHTEYATKTYTDVHRDKNYQVTGRTQKQRQVRVRVVNTIEHLKCAHCSHEWSRSHTSRSS